MAYLTNKNEVMADNKQQTTTIRAWDPLATDLVHYPQTLSHFLHPTHVPVVDVTMATNWYVKVNQRVGVVRLWLAEVPASAWASDHDSTAIVKFQHYS